MNKDRITADIVEFRQQYVEFLHGQLQPPKPIAEAYELVSLLSESKRAYVFLIADRKTKIQYVLKVFDTGNTARQEPLLKELKHPCIPKLIAMYEQNGKTYLIREYFEGVSLAAYLREHGPLSGADMREIALRICDVLAYLHSRPKPVIHRDIKAENIIITDHRAVKLIDFDIAREYDETAGNDTEYYGTREYSPPEQFGYAQTDARTDIYSLGVLMLFMLTGDRERAALPRVKDARYKSIIETCLAFAPKDRYVDVAALRKALVKAGNAHKTIRIRTAGILMAAALLLGALLGFCLPRPSVGPAAVPEGEKPAVFQSSLIERAVRVRLGREDGEPVYEADLQAIDSLHICGGQVFDGTRRLLLEYMPGQTELRVFLDSYGGESIPVRRGDIQALDDLAAMPNLKILDVMFEGISDLTPLEGLPIERLQLAGNNITDLAPLARLPLLTYLNLDGNPVMDLAPLSGLSRLEVLDASYTYIYDLAPLSGLPMLDALYVNYAKISDVSPLAELNLHRVYIKGNQIADFSPLAGVEELYTEDAP